MWLYPTMLIFKTHVSHKLGDGSGHVYIISVDILVHVSVRAVCSQQMRLVKIPTGQSRFKRIDAGK